jgi:hypothetical protein
MGGSNLHIFQNHNPSQHKPASTDSNNRQLVSITKLMTAACPAIENRKTSTHPACCCIGQVVGLIFETK